MSKTLEEIITDSRCIWILKLARVLTIFRYTCLLFFWLWFRYEPKNGNQAAHQRTDDVEEAERKINECRDAKNRTLRHSAGRPRNQYTRNGSTILRTSAQEFRTVASFGIFILIDRSVHDDTQELVTHYEIEQNTGCHRTAYE